MESLPREVGRGAGTITSKGYGMMEAFQIIRSIIDSLQQEQLPGIDEHGVPGKDFIPVEWVDACERYGKWKIVQQEQPKMNIPPAGSGAMGTTPPKFKLNVKQDLPVGLEKEIQEYLEKLGGGHGGFMDDLIDDDLTGLALHFYELGLNARKED